MTRVLLCSLVIGLALGTLPARAETTLCTEISPPATITRPGVYCLFKDYALNLASGAAITVKANNVVLDFNGHRIGNGGAGGSNAAVGVLSGVAREFNEEHVMTVPGESTQNMTLRNGSLLGFHTAVKLTGPFSQGNLVEDMLLDRSLVAGIALRANASVLRRNRVTNAGSASTHSDSVIGISAAGDANVLMDNAVLNSSALTGVIGIHAVSDGGAIVAGNRVIGLTAAGTSDASGVLVNGQVTVSRNVVLNVQVQGGGAPFGIRDPSMLAKVLNNVVSSAGFAYFSNQVAGTNH